MVGLRVFDVGALIVWLVWFFRLRDDDGDDGDDFRGGAGEPDEPDPSGVAARPAHPAARRRRPGPCAGATTSAASTGRAEPQRRRGVPQPVPARAPVKRR